MIKKTLRFNFWPGDKVVLITDPEKKLRIVSGITIRFSGKLYELSCREESSWHQDIEIGRAPETRKAGFNR